MTEKQLLEKILDEVEQLKDQVEIIKKNMIKIDNNTNSNLSLLNKNLKNKKLKNFRRKSVHECKSP